MLSKLSVVIASWNTKEILQNCLDSISKLAEVVVVDNGSTDGTVGYLKDLKKTRKNLQVIFNKRNLGFAKANNQGIKKAARDYILLLNSDTTVSKSSLRKLVKYLINNDDVAAVSPMLVSPEGGKQIDYYKRFPTIFQTIFYHTLLLRSLTTKTFLKNVFFSKVDDDRPFGVDQLPGAALMTRKSVFNRVGLLDEEYSFLYEDVDWCYRVKEDNLGKLIVVPSSQITHIGGASWKKRVEKDRLQFYRHYFDSLMLFVKKHYPSQQKGFKLAIKMTALLNAITHIFLFRWKKALVQFKLAITF